jgi:hypothetical protein
MKTNKEIIEDLMTRVDGYSFIHIGDIPDIDLYMDQVTSFLDDRLKCSMRSPDEKALTKTMINNYAKNRLLPAPEKKKYSREHMLLLICIFYFKNILSLSDIETLFGPMTSEYFSADPSGAKPKLEEIYETILRLNEKNMKDMKSDIKDKYSKAAAEIKGINCSEDSRNYLVLFSFICELAMDAYLKKQMIEQIADEIMKDKVPAKGNHKKEKE